MDVRCERCRAQYVFDDEQVTPSGLTVQCTNCGHVFRVKKKELVVTVPVKPDELHGTPMPATAAAPRAGPHPEPPSPAAPAVEPERREWRVRQASGNVFTFRELTTLQKWIVEQKVSRDDEISRSGEQWKRLGDIGELASFFQVVEAAHRRSPSPVVTPLPPAPSGLPPPASPSAGARPAASRAAPAGEDVEPGSDDLEPARMRRPGRTVLALVLLVAAGAAAYLFRPAPKPPAAPPPITLEVKPAVPPPPAPTPAPAPAVEARAAEQPAAAPDPVAAPVAVPVAVAEPLPPPLLVPAVAPPPPPERPAVPPGPKTLLAQATRLREKGNLERALDLYGRVAAGDPENVDALVGRALCYLDLERYPPAVASFEAALKADPGNPDALLGLGETYRWQGKKAQAIRYYEQYLAEHPDGEEAAVARNALQELRR
jgi:predicted Zn finger-like uncharacterized protein